MKVDAAALFIAGLPGAPAGAGKVETPFAQVLAEGALGQAITGPDPVAIGSGLPLSPDATLAPGRDDADGGARPQPVQAFAFGAFGMFAPGRGGFLAVGTPRPQAFGVAEGPASAAAAATLDPALAPSASASTPPGSAPDGETTAAPVPAPVGLPARQGGHPSITGASSPSSLPKRAEIQGAPGAAPRPPLAPPRRATAPSLTVADQDGRLSVVAGVSGFDPSQYGEARARLTAAAADLGATLDELHINGQAGAQPVRGGSRHGHRAR
jgi:hypothetical protein